MSTASITTAGAAEAQVARAEPGLTLGSARSGHRIVASLWVGPSTPASSRDSQRTCPIVPASTARKRLACEDRNKRPHRKRSRCMARSKKIGMTWLSGLSRRRRKGAVVNACGSGGVVTRVAGISTKLSKFVFVVAGSDCVMACLPGVFRILDTVSMIWWLVAFPLSISILIGQVGKSAPSWVQLSLRRISISMVPTRSRRPSRVAPVARAVSSIAASWLAPRRKSAQ